MGHFAPNQKPTNFSEYAEFCQELEPEMCSAPRSYTVHRLGQGALATTGSQNKCSSRSPPAILHKGPSEGRHIIKILWWLNNVVQEQLSFMRA